MMNVYFYFTLSYTVFSFVMFLMDIYGSDELIKNKIGTKNRNTLMEGYRKIFKLIIFNVYILTIPIYFYDDYYTKSYNKKFILFTETFYFFANIAISEVLFYTFHRILHHPRLYKYFHKIHHEFKQPIGMSALYTHPIDVVIGSIIPDGIGIYLLGGHPYTIRFWVVGAIFFTIMVAHSNFMNLSETHDNHHKLTNYNYGNGYFMDMLFGTKYEVKINKKKTLIHALKNSPSEINNIKNRLRNRNKLNN
jgi:fatty acid hydroxylase domain-containing protein 2